MSIWRWAEWIAPIPREARITLGEANTPLIRSRAIGPQSRLKNLFFKLETTNPTGSYKDRFGVVAVADMVARGRRHAVATSSGNTGAALAAYCAVAGIRCEIAIVETAPQEKLRQMLSYGAELVRVKKFGLDPEITWKTFEMLRERGSRGDSQLLISAFRYCPVGMTGVQTISYELAEQVPGPIHHVFCCAGGGGLALAVARGFNQLRDLGRLTGSVPRVECVQPVGNATISVPLRQGRDRAEPVSCTTAISGLQVPNVIDGDEVIPACRESGGTGHSVNDEFVWLVQARLAREEGVFCEPAAAVPLAGALQAGAEGLLAEDATVVCLVTGSGFKDSASVERMVADRSCPLLDIAAFAARMGVDGQPKGQGRSP
jgi:threonine synthase